MFKLPNPDGYLSASNVKDVTEEIITPLRCRMSRRVPRPRRYLVSRILACVYQTPIWDIYNDTDGTPCDDTVLTWLHSFNRHWLEFVANLQLAHLAVKILDRPG